MVRGFDRGRRIRSGRRDKDRQPGTDKFAQLGIDRATCLITITGMIDTVMGLHDLIGMHHMSVACVHARMRGAYRRDHGKGQEGKYGDKTRDHPVKISMAPPNVHRAGPRAGGGRPGHRISRWGMDMGQHTADPPAGCHVAAARTAARCIKGGLPAGRGRNRFSTDRCLMRLPCPRPVRAFRKGYRRPSCARRERRSFRPQSTA